MPEFVNPKAFDLGSRMELMVDDALIRKCRNLQFRQHPPRRENIVWQCDRPWESPTCGYFTAIQDAGVIRLYYRGGTDELTCYAESQDGIHFTKPELHLYSFEGSRMNNIVFQGDETNSFASHNFAPFLDQNPGALPSQRYKALGGHRLKDGTGRALFAFCSEDGLHWRKLREEPVFREGQFDSLNVPFWDAHAGVYRCYHRIWIHPDGSVPPGGLPVNKGLRGIQSVVSRDFIHWENSQPNRYAAHLPVEEFYTNATSSAPGAPHFLFSFPMRFVKGRKKVPEHSHDGVSDVVMMSSRDGHFWNRVTADAFIPPGLDQDNWTDRSSMTATGIVRISEEEQAIYVSEHYRHEDNRLRRHGFPRDRYVALEAGDEPGECVTHPLTFRGNQLLVNCRTSAAGWLKVEIQDEQGEPMPGFAMDQALEWYGDELDGRIAWQEQKDVASLEGKRIRLRVAMSQAKWYAFRFATLSTDSTSTFPSVES